MKRDRIAAMLHRSHLREDAGPSRAMVRMIVTPATAARGVDDLMRANAHGDVKSALVYALRGRDGVGVEIVGKVLSADPRDDEAGLARIVTSWIRSVRRTGATVEMLRTHYPARRYRAERLAQV